MLALCLCRGVELEEAFWQATAKASMYLAHKDDPLEQLVRNRGLKARDRRILETEMQRCLIHLKEYAKPMKQRNQSLLIMGYAFSSFHPVYVLCHALFKLSDNIDVITMLTAL